MDKIEDDERSERYIEYDDGRDVQNVILNIVVDKTISEKMNCSNRSLLPTSIIFASVALATASATTIAYRYFSYREFDNDNDNNRSYARVYTATS